MTPRGPRRRVALVGAFAVLVVAAVGIGVGRADDAPTLAPVAPDRLLASTLGALSRPWSVSGSVTTELDLGIPELPTSLGGGPAGPLSLIVGTQSWKVWSSPDGLRVAHLLFAREQDLVVNADEAWWWDSLELTAIRLARPPVATEGLGDPGSVGAGPGFDPLRVARSLIEGAAHCASVSIQGTARVAGRDAYVSTLTPIRDDTRIGSMTVAIDAQTYLPLRLRVVPRGSPDAAISVGFTHVSFGAIDPTMFTFDPPPGSTVSDAADPSRSNGGSSEGPGSDAQGAAPAYGEGPTVSDVRTFGSCFDVVVAARVEGPLPEGAAKLLPFSGPLASAIVVDRDDHVWIVGGSVDRAALEARAAALP